MYKLFTLVEKTLNTFTSDVKYMTPPPVTMSQQVTVHMSTYATLPYTAAVYGVMTKHIQCIYIQHKNIEHIYIECRIRRTPTPGVGQVGPT